MDQTEKVKIPISLLSDLYKNILIDTSIPKTIQEKKAIDAVIVVYGSADNQDRESSELLSAIMTACKLNQANSAVLYSKPNDEVNIQFVKEHYTAATIILFGIAPTTFGLPINFPSFQIQKVENTQYVVSPGLEEMLKDKSLKVKLWNSLKQIFV